MQRQTSHSESREPFLEKILSYFRFRKITGKIPDNVIVLDLGCGFSGDLLNNINKKISKGIGVDVSVDKKKANSKIELIEYDLNEKLPFPNNYFDVVISLANLEHLNNPQKNLREIHRVLKPGGILLLTTPSIYSKPVLEFLSYRLNLISQAEIKDHKNYFNKKILLKYCKQAGFLLIKHGYFQFFMNNFLYAKK